MSDSEKSDQRSKSLRVLVVEDENLIAILLEDMLADLGHEVVGPAGRLNKALELAQEADIDVAILDVNLNGQDSSPVAAALAERGIPFLFSTGYGWTKFREPYSDAPVLQKPFQQADLEQALAALIGPEKP